MGGSPQVRERVFIPAVRKRRDDSRLLLQAIRQLQDVTWSPDKWDISSILQTHSAREVTDYRLSGEEKTWLSAWNWLLRKIPADDLPGFPLWSDDFVVRRRFSRSEPHWKHDFWRKNSEFYIEYREIIDEWKEIQHGPMRLRIADFPRSRRKFEWQAREWQPRRRDRNIWDLLIHLRPSGIRVRPPTYAPALVAMAQTSIVGSQRRRLTPAECARLQGFARDPYRGIDVPDAVKYRQLGNAVHVGLVRVLSSRLLGLSDVA
jgi:DNA (cytosine-5)-methyltransferase 1